VMMGVMRMFFLQADVILVGMLLGTTEAGIYAIASRLTQLVGIGNLSSNAIAGPLIARSWARRDRRETQRIASVSSQFATLIAIVAGAALLVLDRTVLSWAGQDFVQGTTVVQLLVLGSLVNAVTGPVGQIMNLTGHERVNAKISGVVLVAYLVASVPVISSWGIVGAAALRAAAVAVKNLWTWFVVRNELRISSVAFSKDSSS